jgi:YjbE family integral membrane protein
MKQAAEPGNDGCGAATDALAWSSGHTGAAVQERAGDMDFISMSELVALAQVVLVDLVLAGDNAIVVGIAVAGLPAEQRWRVMVLGIGAATVLRIVFASFTVQLLQIIGLLLAGGLLLLWVCWKLWRELRSGRLIELPGAEGEAGARVAAQKTMRQAVTQIIVADVSMSLDNVLAVAGVARDHAWVLVFGLALSVAFMGLAAAVIARLLGRFHWIAYVGLAVILYVALRMIYEGGLEVIAVAGGT